MGITFTTAQFFRGFNIHDDGDSPKKALKGFCGVKWRRKAI